MLRFEQANRLTRDYAFLQKKFVAFKVSPLGSCCLCLPIHSFQRIHILNKYGKIFLPLNSNKPHQLLCWMETALTVIYYLNPEGQLSQTELENNFWHTFSTKIDWPAKEDKERCQPRKFTNKLAVESSIYSNLISDDMTHSSIWATAYQSNKSLFEITLPQRQYTKFHVQWGQKIHSTPSYPFRRQQSRKTR